MVDLNTLVSLNDLLGRNLLCTFTLLRDNICSRNRYAPLNEDRPPVCLYIMNTTHYFSFFSILSFQQELPEVERGKTRPIQIQSDVDEEKTVQPAKFPVHLVPIHFIRCSSQRRISA